MLTNDLNESSTNDKDFKPKSSHRADTRQNTNSFIGYTPDPALTACATNWLELVANCKSSANER